MSLRPYDFQSNHSTIPPNTNTFERCLYKLQIASKLNKFEKYLCSLFNKKKINLFFL